MTHRERAAHAGQVAVRLQLSQLEDRTNPSHTFDPPAGAPWGPPVTDAAEVAPTSPRAGVAAGHVVGPTRAQERFEIKFMEGMIDHHMMAVMMAQLCEERAVHPELREMCQEIEQAQMREMAQMQAWLKEWYGINYEPQMTRGMERQMEQLASLGGAEFEVEFMQMMIRHHEKAVREGERCVERAFHPELIQLCQDIVETQQQEIQTMQTWLHDWYGVHSPHRR